MEFFNQVIEHLTNLKLLSTSTDSGVQFKNIVDQVKKHLIRYFSNFSNDPEIELLKKAFTNICSAHPEFNSSVDRERYRNQLKPIFEVIGIFSAAIFKATNQQIKYLERKLFSISFLPKEDKSILILPVYQQYSSFLTFRKPVVLMQSTTGSGKSRCSPILLSIRAYQDMNCPYIFMIEPNYPIIENKFRDFKNLFNDSVHLITQIAEFETIYSKQLDKPVLALFTPMLVFQLIHEFSDFELFNKSRFILDEFHERSIDYDLLISIIASQMNAMNNSVPFQVLLLSSTPDRRVLNCFNSFLPITLPEPPLFKITDIPVRVSNINDLNDLVSQSTTNLLKQIHTKQIAPGNILVFTSGQRQNDQLIHLMKDTIIKECRDEISLLNLNRFISEKTFIERLSRLDKDKCYCVILQYSDVNSETKNICQNSHSSNVIKIILATSIYESSIIIDNLAAVFDTSLYELRDYDDQYGLLLYNEATISKQMQEQRRGKLGRKRDGVCLQFSIDGYKITPDSSYAMIDPDLQSKILSFRKFDIKIESTKKLPAPQLDKRIIKHYLKELIAIGALDKTTKKITNYGRILATFTYLPPDIISSILKVTEKFNFEDKAIANLVGSFIYLIIITDNLCLNPMSEAFRRNFCIDSDVITLMNTIIDAKLKKSDDLYFLLSEYGFNSINAIKIIIEVEQMASFIFEEEEIDLWAKFQDFVLMNDMMEFIQVLLIEIEKNKKEWIGCKRATYITVSNLIDQYHFNYLGHKSLTEDGQKPVIEVKTRPGAKGLLTPGKCFILQICIECNNRFIGSLIHKDIGQTEVCHPEIIEASGVLNNPFTSVLIETLLMNFIDNFRLFQVNDTTNLKTGVMCFTEQYEDKTILSFANKIQGNDESHQLLIQSINKIEQILSFIPRTILVNYDLVKSIVAITGIGTNNIKTKVLLYTDETPYAYQIDETTIDYLIDHKNELNDVDGHLVIAMTGEELVYSDDSIGLPFTGKPTIGNETSVFCPDTISHLVILSDKEIPNAIRLAWVNENIPSMFTENDSLIHYANSIYRGVIEVRHSFDLICFIQHQIYLKSNQSRRQFERRMMRNVLGNRELHNEIPLTYQSFQSLFDHIWDEYFTDSKLTNRIPFQEFKESGVLPRFSSDYGKFNQIRSSISHFSLADINQLKLKITRIQAQIDTFNKQLQNLNNNSHLDSENPFENESNPEQVEKIRKKIENRIRDLTDAQNDVFHQFNFDPKIFKQISEIKLPLELYTNLLDVDMKMGFLKVKVDNVKKTHDFLVSHLKIKTEIVQISTVKIYHLIFNTLSELEFESRINQITSKYGILIYKKENYTPQKTKSTRGYIMVYLYSSQFTIPFVKDVNALLKEYDRIELSFPSNIYPKCLLDNPDMQHSIEQWITTNHLKLQTRGNRYFGLYSEVEKAKELLKIKEKHPVIPFQLFPIPSELEMNVVIEKVNLHNSRWFINKISRILYATLGVDESEIMDLFNEIQQSPHKTVSEAIIFDYALICEEDAILSNRQIPIYKENGDIEFFNYCLTCGKQLFADCLSDFFDAENDEPKLNRIYESRNVIDPIPLFGDENNDPEEIHPVWPQIPIGQLYLSLLSQTELTSLARTYLTAISYRALQNSDDFIQCPQHPQYLIRKIEGTRIQCYVEGCNQFLCNVCKEWHRPGQCQIREIPPGYRRCPKCKVVVLKIEACNHISCKCGYHFCYYCGQGYSKGALVYGHLTQEHNGYYNDPPDYRKYYKNEKVSDEELEAFYKKYPDFRPLESPSNNTKD